MWLTLFWDEPLKTITSRGSARNLQSSKGMLKSLWRWIIFSIIFPNPTSIAFFSAPSSVLLICLSNVSCFCVKCVSYWLMIFWIDSGKSFVPSNKEYFDKGEELLQWLHRAVTLDFCKSSINFEISDSKRYYFLRI